MATSRKNPKASTGKAKANGSGSKRQPAARKPASGKRNGAATGNGAAQLRKHARHNAVTQVLHHDGVEELGRDEIVPDELRVPELLDSTDVREREVREARKRYRTAKVGVETQVVDRIFLRVRELREAHPDLSSEIGINEWKIRERLRNIRAMIDQFPEEDRELVTVLVINTIHKACDEVLVDPHLASLQEPAPSPALGATFAADNAAGGMRI